MKYLNYLFILLFVGVMTVWLYWTIVMSVSGGYRKDSNEIGMEGLLYQTKSLRYNSDEDWKRADSCFYIQHYLWEKADNIRHTYLPKFMIP